MSKLNNNLDECEFLKSAVDYRLSIHIHPIFNYACVYPSEIVIKVQIPFEKLAFFQRRIFAIQATIHMITDQEGHASRTVVSTRPIIMNSATKLSKH